MAINSDDKTNQKTLNHLKKYKIFIVDEISMINAALWNKLIVLKKTTGAIFILLGDYRQCPPIEDGKETDYFTHPYAKALTNYNRCELVKPQRYDMKMWKWLEDFYKDGWEGKMIKKKKPSKEDILTRRNIVYTNKTRTRINNFCMEEISKGKNAFIVLGIPDKCKNEKAVKATIYIGLPVMAIANNKDYEIINSEEFIVDKFNGNNEVIHIKAVDDDREVIVEFKHFHTNFVVNYAATTHKSQGATYTNGINIWDWDYMREDRRIGYTAISRGKTCEQIWICDRERILTSAIGNRCFPYDPS
jgi:ATP-dependent exoDNAse (exonuclease V) alpha subunit